MTFSGFSLFFSGKKCIKAAASTTTMQIQLQKRHGQVTQVPPTAVTNCSWCVSSDKAQNCKVRRSATSRATKWSGSWGKTSPKTQRLPVSGGYFKTMAGFIMASTTIFWETYFDVVAMWCSSMLRLNHHQTIWKALKVCLLTWHGFWFLWCICLNCSPKAFTAVENNHFQLTWVQQKFSTIAGLGYGSIPMKIPFLVGWTSILTQLWLGVH